MQEAPRGAYVASIRRARRRRAANLGDFDDDDDDDEARSLVDESRGFFSQRPLRRPVITIMLARPSSLCAIFTTGIPWPPARPAHYSSGCKAEEQPPPLLESLYPPTDANECTRGQHPAYIARLSVLRDGSSSERCGKPPPSSDHEIIIIAEIYVRRFSRDLLLRVDRCNA